MNHPFNRKNQVVAYEAILESDKQFIITRLDTGSGKSAIACQIALDGYKTLALVQTKSLQGQYADSYEFANITGKGDYECLQIGQQKKMFEEEKATADLCVCPKSMKRECNTQCPYPLARQEFVSGEAGVTNYAKMLRDRALINSTDYVDGFDPDYLFLDEAHELSDLVVDFAGLSLSWKSKRLMQYCEPIFLSLDQVVKETGLPEPMAKDELLELAFDWLGNLYRNMKDNPPLHPSQGGDVKNYKWYQNKLEKIDVVLEASKTEPDCWFAHSNEYGLTIKPLTAKFHFKSLFDRCNKIVMMSATVPRHSQLSVYKPQFDTLGLGIPVSEYDLIDLPHPYPVEDRPIFLLDTPNITWRTSDEDKKIHAKLISGEINKTPGHWITMIHFPSKAKAKYWSFWIKHYTKRPVYVPETNISTIKAYDNWLEFKDHRRGAICCAWQFWTGIDAGYVNTNIIAGMPYPNFGDPFQKARFEYNPGEARGRVANMVMQGDGRSRRGHDSHYGPDAEKLNIICNSSKFQRLRSAFSKDFLRSIKR